MQIAQAILAEADFLTADVELSRRTGQIDKLNIILFWFAGKAYAYLNHCMHMRRPLNCQSDAIFDRARGRLRCSMHGFVFEPETGVCLSPVCEGQKLTAFKLIEQDGQIGLQDKHARIVAVYRNGKEKL